MGHSHVNRVIISLGAARQLWPLALLLSALTSGCYTIGTVQTLRYCAPQAPAVVFSAVGTHAPTVAWTLNCATIPPGVNYVSERAGTLELAVPVGCTAPLVYVLSPHSDHQVCSGETQPVHKDGRFALQPVDPITAATAALKVPTDECALLVAIQQEHAAPHVVALASDGRVAAREPVQTPIGGWLALPTAAFIDVVFVTPVMIIGGLISLPYWLLTGHVSEGEGKRPEIDATAPPCRVEVTNSDARFEH